MNRAERITSRRTRMHRRAPLIFYGAPFAPGVYHGRVEPVDIAATFAALLGLNQPSASVGRILTQSMKPAAAVVYPKPAPPAHARATHRRAASESQPVKPDMSVQFAGIAPQSGHRRQRDIRLRY